MKRVFLSLILLCVFITSFSIPVFADDDSVTVHISSSAVAELLSYRYTYYQDNLYVSDSALISANTTWSSASSSAYFLEIPDDLYGDDYGAVIIRMIGSSTITNYAQVMAYFSDVATLISDGYSISEFGVSVGAGYSTSSGSNTYYISYQGQTVFGYLDGEFVSGSANSRLLSTNGETLTLYNYSSGSISGSYSGIFYGNLYFCDLVWSDIDSISDLYVGSLNVNTSELANLYLTNFYYVVPSSSTADIIASINDINNTIVDESSKIQVSIEDNTVKITTAIDTAVSELSDTLTIPTDENSDSISDLESSEDEALQKFDDYIEAEESVLSDDDIQSAIDDSSSAFDDAQSTVDDVISSIDGSEVFLSYIDIFSFDVWGWDIFAPICILVLGLWLCSYIIYGKMG